MIGEIISVGTELLLGNIINTNAAYIAEQLACVGISVYYQTTVGDNEERLSFLLKEALKRSDCIFITGGLGPTEDDITKETAGKILGASFVEDAKARKNIENVFRAKNMKVTSNNWKQAQVPEGSIVIQNENGTAPGIIMVTDENKKIFLLPGPPNECIPMFENGVLPLLKKMDEGVIYSETVKIAGLGESFVETQISDLVKTQQNPTIAPYAKTGEVHLRITARAKNKKEAQNMVAPMIEALKERFGYYVYACDEKITLEESMVEFLKKKELKIATAESCTGGLVSGRLINVPGASDVLNMSVVTYSNKAKRKVLGVKKSVLKTYGAVSEETAKEMAVGVAKYTKSDVGISVTGIAGPGGGTKDKPTGTVCIGCAWGDFVETKTFHFNGNRQKVREQSCAYALIFARECLIRWAQK